MTQTKRPAPPQSRPSANTTNTADSSLYRRQDGYAAPTPEERREAQVLAEVKALGYGITVPCLLCGHALTSARSLARHIGPRCAARAVAE